MSDPVTLKVRLEEGSVVVESVKIGWEPSDDPEMDRRRNPIIEIPCNGGMIELSALLQLTRRGVGVETFS